MQKSLNATVGDDQYSRARKEVLTHLCSRPMQVSSGLDPGGSEVELRSWFLSSQMALYFCTGSFSEEKHFKHYALNVPLYTHFTSPIRRYADVIVHRLLAASLSRYHLSSAPDPLTSAELTPSPGLLPLLIFRMWP